MTEHNLSNNAKPILRAQTLRFQGPVNVAVRSLLRTPLISRALGKRLIVIEVVGRRSGRHFEVPVAYTARDGSLLVGSPFAWLRNLVSGEPVYIRLAGRRRLADVLLLSDEAGVVEHLGLMASDNHQFAKFNRIGIDRSGKPVPEDLHAAWAAGTRVVLLTPQ